MKRIMVNLEDSLGEMIEKRATEQRRSASSYIAVIIEADLRAAGLIPPPTVAARAALLTEIQQALVDQPDILPAIKQLIVNRRRATKRVRAVSSAAA